MADTATVPDASAPDAVAEDAVAEDEPATETPAEVGVTAEAVSGVDEVTAAE